VAVPVSGRFTIRYRDVVGDITGAVGDITTGLVPGFVKQATHRIKPLMGQARKAGTAVEAQFSLDFGGLHLTFTVEDFPMESRRLKNPRAAEQWQGSMAAEVRCEALIDYIIGEVKRRVDDDARD
jgi:hypothetical protein